MKILINTHRISHFIKSSPEPMPYLLNAIISLLSPYNNRLILDMFPKSVIALTQLKIFFNLQIDFIILMKTIMIEIE